MAEKSSDSRPRRKPSRERVELVLTSALPSDVKVKQPSEAQPPRSEPPVSTEERARWIAEAAYFRAEVRGFSGGFELEDWLAAESEYDGLLAHGANPGNGPAH
jgi:hypothetical protein